MYRFIAIATFSVVCAVAQVVSIDAQGPATAFVQGPPPGGVAVVGFSVPFLGVGPDVVTGAPYSAQATTQRVQVLADGNRIEETFSQNVVRDSAGRVRMEHVLPRMEGSSDKPGPPPLVSIKDPVAGYEYLLDLNSKTATKMPLPTGPQAASAAKAKGMAVERIEKAGIPAETGASKTDLGTQTIEGVPAQGTRMTRTIPAGTIGNSMAIEITTETWYSPDLKVIVQSKSTDPRLGDTTYTLANIDRSEPAASLFQIPADYTVKDGPAKNFVYQTFQKAPTSN